MQPIKELNDSNLSYYRTEHYFERYAEFTSLEEYNNYCQWAKQQGIKLYILGNGSNTLYQKQRVKSLILKNKLPKKIEALSTNRFEVSSTVLVLELLKVCLSKSLDSFYYLASVPATIGGALAMNAGRGRKHNLTIYDFVESVSFYDHESDTVKTLGKEEIVQGYRQTIFTGVQSRLVLSAVFKFPELTTPGNPIMERCRWSKKFQDYSGPNCGSVFKAVDFEIMKKLQGFSLGKTCFSERSVNWITNHSKNSRKILFLIWIAKILHRLKGKKAELEIIIVD